MGFFWAKCILFNLKKYRGVIFHKTEDGYKIWRGIDLLFQNWHKEFHKFWPEHSKVSIFFTLMGFFWAKYIGQAKKVHRSYLSWNWRGIQNLDGIDLSFQNWHKQFDKFWPEHSKVSIFFTLMSFFWAKYILLKLKKHRGVIFHKTEEGFKISREIDLSFQNWHKKFHKFWREHSKVSIIFTLMGFFWAKYIFFELKKVQRSYLSWNWRGIHNLERNWLVISKLTEGIWQILT